MDYPIGQCIARRVRESDDDYIFLERADPYILISDAFLANIDERFGAVGDGILTLFARNGDVSYGLSQHDDARCQWLGTRSDQLASNLT